MPDHSLRRPLETLHRAQERARLLRHVLRAGAAAAVAIVLALVLGVLFAPGVAGAWARLAALTLAMLVILALALRVTRRESSGLDAWLERAEAHFPALRSWLRNALELEARPPVHGSTELAAAVVREASDRLPSVPLAELGPKLEPRTPALLMAGSLAVVIALALIAPQRTQRSWATLWSPALAAPPVRLEVEPGSVTLSPGATLAVRARVWGTTEAPRLALGDGARARAQSEGTGESGGRLWRFDLSQLTRETTYRVRVASVESDRYAIRFSGEASPVGFRIEYRAPAYARLPVQAGAAARGDLSALRGSVAAVEVTFDRDLERLDATLPDGRAERWIPVTPRRWRGEVPMLREGEYTLSALARPLAAGGTPTATRHAYRVNPLDDAPPVLSVRLPEGDMDLPEGQQIPLDVLAQDDLGLGDLTLEYRKDADAAWRPLPLARFSARPREASVATRWDAAPLALVPGELASFRLRLTDDNLVTGPGVAISPIFTLRFPSLAELYEQVDKRQDAARTSLEKAAEQARELQKSLDKLQRQQPTQSNDKPPSFERAEEMKSATERQQEISKQVNDASQQLRQSLEQAAERRAFDEQLQRKLQEMNELMQQVRSEEFKDALEKMQKALEAMDRQQMEHNLDRMQKANQQMLQNLERTIALLKQLREEEKLQALAKRAEELKQQQDALNRQHDSPPPSPSKPSKPNEAPNSEPSTADRQQQAAEESEKLAAETREAMQAPEAAQAREQMEKASETLEQQAAQQQHSASQSSQQGKRTQAKQQGQKASESLESAAQQLQQAVQQLQQSEQDTDLSALRRAAQDLVALQRSVEQNLASEAPLPQRGDQQTDLAEGAARIADSLQALGKRTPGLSPALTEALGRAMNGLHRSGIEMGSGNRMRGEQLGREGATGLNQAVLELRSAEQSMCNKPGNSPGNKQGSNPQRLGDVGEQQSRLNGKSQSLAKRLTQQLKMSAGDQDEVRRLADEQARIRSELESIQRDEAQHKELLGRLDQTQQDMRQVEEQLRQGVSPGDLEQQQQRILSRLLDAQRSVNRRDFEPERQSRPGEDIARESPAELPASLMREDDRLRLDLLKAEADRYPAQYRGFIEAYLRSLNGSRR